jgi:BirA family biotin operon repressor/biotin-[acetyl-CoA-carboxylase] ligase
MINPFDIVRRGLQVEYFARTESTNKLAREDNSGKSCLWIADFQSAGRGQRGNSWYSIEGQNLMFTLSLFPTSVAAEDQFQISEITALSVCKVLEQVGITAQIKWPNDIYVGDRKICGILIEHDLVGKYLSRSIIGVGINVNQCEFDKSIPNPTSVSLESDCQYFDRNRILQNFVDIFFDLYGQLVNGENFDSIYVSNLYRRDGKYYPYRLASGIEISARIDGVDSFGRLKIKDSEQNDYSLAFKEIEYIIG